MNFFRRRGDDEYEEYDDDYGRRSFGRMLVGFLLFPFRVLLSPFRGLGKVRGVDDHELKVPFTLRVGHALKTLFLLPFRFLRAFTDSLVVLSTRRDVRFLLVAFLLVGVSVLAYFLMARQAQLLETRNLKGAQEALNSSPPDFELAKSYYQELVGKKDLPPPQNFEWATILANTGETERAQELIQKLAPDDRPGYGPAHRVRAIELAQQLAATGDRSGLPILYRHLQNAQDDSPDIQQAWAVYYLATEQFDNALTALDKSDQPDPNQYTLIAAVYKAQERISDYKLTLEKARQRFQALLDEDKKDSPTRIALARVVANLEEFNQAERILMDGLRIQPDAALNRAIADLNIMQYDIAENWNQTDLQLKFLNKALQSDRDYPLVYEKMMAILLDPNRPEMAAEVRATLQTIVDGEQPTSQAHFALSNVFLKEGDKEQAQFHLEQAYKLDENIVLAINNLAWMIADGDEPDLERALELSTKAVEKRPRDYRLLGTLGTIYLKMGRDSEAVIELKKYLSVAADKKEVHRKLALAYQNLSQPEMAKMHEEQAK